MKTIDHPRLAQLEQLLGQDRLLALADQLAQGVAALANVPDAALPDHLHRLRGSAASLGLTGLAQHIAQAEEGLCSAAELPAIDLPGLAPDIVPLMAAALQSGSRQR